MLWNIAIHVPFADRGWRPIVRSAAKLDASRSFQKNTTVSRWMQMSMAGLLQSARVPLSSSMGPVKPMRKPTRIDNSKQAAAPLTPPWKAARIRKPEPPKNDVLSVLRKRLEKALVGLSGDMPKGWQGRDLTTAMKPSREDFPVPDLVKFALGTVLRFPTAGPEEKVRWTVPRANFTRSGTGKSSRDEIGRAHV